MDICPECRCALPPQADLALKREYEILKVHLKAAEKKLGELGYIKKYAKHSAPCLETIWVNKDEL